jgi:Ser/Thr protein kinase RdoA (MazF antagonist)
MDAQPDDPVDMFRFDPPQLDVDDALLIARERWDIDGTGRRLPGERSFNALIETSAGRHVVLKIQSASEDPATIDLHARALRHVERRAPGLPVARMLPTTDGELVPGLSIRGRIHPARMVTFLPGEEFDGADAVSERGLRAIGGLLGGLAAALADFEHPAARGFMAWDLANGLVLDGAMRIGIGAESARVLELADDRLRRTVDLMPSLPRQIIHNDGHAGNLLRPHDESDEVCGVIDFGDVVHTIRVADVAIAGESFAPTDTDPAGVLAALTAGYHAHHPLTAAEIAAIPDLVLVRMALTVVLLEHQIAAVPHLAGRAAHHLPHVVRATERWLHLDAARLVDRIEAAVEGTT